MLSKCIPHSTHPNAKYPLKRADHVRLVVLHHSVVGHLQAAVDHGALQVAVANDVHVMGWGRVVDGCSRWLSVCRHAPRGSILQALHTTDWGLTAVRQAVVATRRLTACRWCMLWVWTCGSTYCGRVAVAGTYEAAYAGVVTLGCNIWGQPCLDCSKCLFRDGADLHE